ncbi:MAG TPA: thermonuclease family protein [Solirubrobacterales bacterium]|nr:thermonuclease family protein [Solirubrobacterales bacterium]
MLLIAAASVVLRPWEGLDAAETGPRAAFARVARVVDGDTFEARIEGKIEDVRLIGVDTPETVDPEEPVQCFGPRASRFTHRAVEGRRVRLVFGVERRDAYGRLLAYAYVDRRFVNAALVRRGLARTLSIPPNTRHRALFEHLELAAARAGRGLWSACPP